MDETPLIYTTKGNVPIDSLIHCPTWEEGDDYIKFIDTYTLDGEVVKQSVHLKIKRGISVMLEQGSFG